jgi:membrane protein implicated in regulation of membrane protease activity
MLNKMLFFGSLSDSLMNIISTHPHVFWIVIGAGLCLIELFAFPTSFILFVMGVSAILVGVFSTIVPGLYPNIHLQIVLWIIFSAVNVYLSQRLMPRGKYTNIAGATEAKTLTEIPAGDCGRVIYEGNSWRARCGNENLVIPADTKVIVIDRDGTTLIVMPQNLLK